MSMVMRRAYVADPFGRNRSPSFFIPQRARCSGEASANERGGESRAALADIISSFRTARPSPVLLALPLSLLPSPLLVPFLSFRYDAMPITRVLPTGQTVSYQVSFLKDPLTNDVKGGWHHTRVHLLLAEVSPPPRSVQDHCSGGRDH